jgi:hypothetical protein
MLSVILSACALVIVTVAVHATGIVVLVRRLVWLGATPLTRAWPIARLLLRMIWWLMLLHLTEIAVWGLFYLWRRCLPDADAAFYFSGATYTTLGYGDVVLAKPWRMLGPMEALSGILMGGLSTGYFFVIVSRIHQSLHVEATAVSTAERAEPRK